MAVAHERDLRHTPERLRRAAAHRRDGRLFLEREAAALASHGALAHLDDLAGDGNGDGADLLAGVAGGAEGVGLTRGLQPVVNGGEHQADRPGVDVAEGVTAHHRVGRTDVGAGAAADATKGVAQVWVLPRLPAAVIEEHDVVLKGAVHAHGQVHLDVTGAAGAGDHVHVRGEALAGGVAGQHIEDLGRVVQRGYDLFHPHDRHVHGRQRGHQVGVALVSDDDDGAGVGDADVGAGDADVGAQELLAQGAPGEAHQRLGLRRQRLTAHGREQLGDLLAREVNGGCDQVGGVVVRQLDDPLAQVGLYHLDAQPLQIAVELDFLGSHGLGFDGQLHPTLPGDVADDAAGVGGGGCPVDVGAHPFGSLDEPLHQRGEVIDGLGLHGPQPALHLGELPGCEQRVASVTQCGEPAPERNRDVLAL